MNIKHKDIISGFFFLMFAVFLYAMSFTLTQSKAESLGPGFFPRIVAFSMAGLAIMLISKAIISQRKAGQAVPAKSEAEVEKEAGFKINYSFALSVLILIAYMLLIKYVGFIIISMIYLFCQILLISAKEEMKRKNIIINAIISVVVPIVVYLVFYHVFNIFLPTGLLG